MLFIRKKATLRLGPFSSRSKEVEFPTIVEEWSCMAARGLLQPSGNGSNSSNWLHLITKFMGLDIVMVPDRA